MLSRSMTSQANTVHGFGMLLGLIHHDCPCCVRLHEGSPERARWFNTAVEAMWVPMLEVSYALLMPKTGHDGFPVTTVPSSLPVPFFLFVLCFVDLL